MGTIIFIGIAIIIIAMIASNKNKQVAKPASNSSTDRYISMMKEELNEKKQEMLQEFTQIGFEALSSLEMSKEEKEDLMTQVVNSIREHTPDNEQKYISQIIRKSYDFLFDKFSFDREFCTELLTHFDKFELNVKEKNITSDSWIILIDAIEKEKEKIQNTNIVDEQEYSDTLSFALKGLNYRNEEEQAAAEDLEEGDELILEAEPANKYDPFAIKVLTTDGFHIGYVEATKCRFISENMQRLIKCRIKQISKYENLYIYGLAYFE